MTVVLDAAGLLRSVGLLADGPGVNLPGSLDMPLFTLQRKLGDPVVTGPGSGFDVPGHGMADVREREWPATDHLTSVDGASDRLIGNVREPAEFAADRGGVRVR